MLVYFYACKFKLFDRESTWILGNKLVSYMNMIAALSPWDTIGSQGVRNFMLCKKPQPVKMEGDEERSMQQISSKGNGSGSGSWKAWINKSLNLKIYSHWLIIIIPQLKSKWWWRKVFMLFFLFVSFISWWFQFPRSISYVWASLLIDICLFLFRSWWLWCVLEKNLQLYLTNKIWGFGLK